jgi:hypothetical protein
MSLFYTFMHRTVPDMFIWRCRATFSCSEQGSSRLSHCRGTRVSSTPLSRRLLAGLRSLARHEHNHDEGCLFGRARNHDHHLVYCGILDSEPEQMNMDVVIHVSEFLLRVCMAVRHCSVSEARATGIHVTMLLEQKPGELH